MAVVRLRLKVAAGAGKDFVVVGISVTSSADTIRLAMIRRKPCVIERSTSPYDCTVAGGASLGKTSRNVIGVGGRIVFHSVTGIAIRRSTREFSSDMTL